MKFIYAGLISTLFLLPFVCRAQVSVSPSRIYYKVGAGGSSTQRILLTNPNDKEVEVAVSVGDWKYDSLGNNLILDAGALRTTCADWIQVLPGSFFTLGPNERRELNIVLNVPPGADKSIPVHNAIIFVTQLNAPPDRTTPGTRFNITLRMGVKLYHSFVQPEEKNIEIEDFKETNDSTGLADALALTFRNTGKFWIEGKLNWELINTLTGEKIKLEGQDIFSLPGDTRIVTKKIPPKVAKGSYTATAVFNYGSKDDLKIAELEFVR